MRKYKISTYTFLLSLTLGLGSISCSSDFTELDPLGNTSYENFFKTEQDAISAANGLYDMMDEGEMFGRGFFWYMNASDDMITGRLNAAADNIKNFNMNGDENYVNSIYQNCYKVIRRSNDILKKVPGIQMSEPLKKRILGEAYFMRAFHYFWLAHSYGDNGDNGGVPIVTVENMDQLAGSFKRPTSVVENYAQIIEDFQKSIELLPLFTELTSDNYGRAHRDAAYAYMAKTYLYWGQYDNSQFANVIKAADAVTNSGSGRKLINTGNPAQDYRLLHSHVNNWTSEYIWSVNSGVEGGSILPGCMLENKGWGAYNGWGYFQPSLGLLNEFEAGDKRKEVTILSYGDSFEYFGTVKRYSSENSLSGMQFNKYMYEYKTADALGTMINVSGDNPTTKYNVPLMRYAEVILMKAEAKIRLGQNADAEINSIRERAGLASIAGATMKELKHERRVELAGEFANRHFDLVRWGDAAAAYGQPILGKVYKNRANPDSEFTIQEVWKKRNFDASYMHVWPIPNKAVQSSGIKQNKGW